MKPRQPKRYSASFEFSRSVAEVWAVLSDTDHMNRFLSLPVVTYGPLAEGTHALERTANAKHGRLALTWVEHPFQWVRGRQFSITREFSTGPFSRFWHELSLVQTERGTRADFSFELTARNFITVPLMPVLARRALRSTLRYYRTVEQQFGIAQADGYPRRQLGVKALRPLNDAIAGLRASAQTAGDLVDRLENHLLSGTDGEVTRMRPYGLAERWKTPRRATLRLFLEATRRGILALEWELVCPNCRVPKASYKSLALLESRFHCDLCGIDFQSDMAANTELRFTVDARLRPAHQATYCLGGPMSARHILVQTTLQAGTSQSFELPLDRARYRVRVLRKGDVFPIHPIPAGRGATGPFPLAFRLTSGGWKSEIAQFVPGRNAIVWRNDTAEDLTLVFEEWGMDPLAVSAAEVTSLPEFRREFSAEVLAPDRQIGIRSVCILFTDLKASTQFYERVGDAPAFGVVRRHFDFISGCIDKNGGSVVKTIGDAVMAVFPSAGRALAAGIQIQKGVDGFCRTLPGQPPLEVKVGIHQGPAICVNSNGQLDYFGRTVNIAARIQGESEGGDILMADEMTRDLGVRAVLAKADCPLSRSTRELKGFGGQFTLCRVVVRRELGYAAKDTAGKSERGAG